MSQQMERCGSMEGGTDYIPIAEVQPCFACGCAILSCLVTSAAF